MWHARHRTYRLTGIIAAAAGIMLALPVGQAAANAGTDQPRNGPIAFGRYEPRLGYFTLWTADSDGSHQHQLTSLPTFMSDWHPSGTSLAFDFFDDAGEHIATIRRDGTGFHQLTSSRGIQEVPRYSPDGQQIVYDASSQQPDDPGFHTDIWIMQANGSHPHQVTHDGFDIEPVFSPDGLNIAFGRIVGPTSPTDTNQNEAIYVAHADGSALHEVVSPRPGLEHPRWSPDGRQLTFNIAPEAEGAPGAGTIYSVHPDGSGLRVIRAATSSWLFTKAVWSPDGRQMIVVCHHGHDVSVGADNLCALDPSTGRFNLVVAGSHRQPVNFPSWGARPRCRHLQSTLLDMRDAR